MKITKGQHGCSDGGCVFGHPGGMHTNSGCKCIPTTFGAYERTQLRITILSLRNERDNLIDALSYMLENHKDCGCRVCKFTKNQWVKQ